MNTLLLIYNFAITTILGVTSLTSAKNSTEYLFAALFFPLSFYFLGRILKNVIRKAELRRAVSFHRYLSTPSSLVAPTLREINTNGESPALEGELINDGKPIKDLDKRLFLKLIASSGISIFLLSLFTKEAHGAFFGSVPGPGTVAVKDSSGNLIDPSEKQPTDGYEIAKLDDTSSTDYSYYGFVNKDGYWYVMRETLTGASAGSYLYARGTTDFDTNWSNRSTSLSYDSFNATF